jgi:hypothetical protein
LGCLFGKERVVGYTIFHCGDRELIPHLIYCTISSYLQESDKTLGFLIDSGDTYSVAYNGRRHELFICGFWVPGEQFDDLKADQIRAYIDLILQHKALPPIPPGIHYDLILKYPDNE